MVKARINELMYVDDSLIEFFNCSEVLDIVLRNLFGEITYIKCYLANAKIEALSQRARYYSEQIFRIKQQLKKLKQEHKFIFLNRDVYIKLKELKRELVIFEIAIGEIGEKIACLERERFYNRAEKKQRFTKMLLDLGFKCVDRHHNRTLGQCTTEYGFNGNEDNLLLQAEMQYDAIKKQRRQKKEEILAKYGYDSILKNLEENKNITSQ